MNHQRAHILLTIIVAGLMFAPLSLNSGMRAQQASSRQELGDVASIDLLPRMTLSKPEPTSLDFKVFYVLLGDEPLLGLYFGNAPSFEYDGAEVTRIDGCTALSNAQTVSAAKSRDVLFAIENANQYPQKLHAFYRELNPDEARLADAAIASIVFLKGHDCFKGDPVK